MDSRLVKKTLSNCRRRNSVELLEKFCPSAGQFPRWTSSWPLRAYAETARNFRVITIRLDTAVLYKRLKSSGGDCALQMSSCWDFALKIVTNHGRMQIRLDCGMKKGGAKHHISSSPVRFVRLDEKAPRSRRLSLTPLHGREIPEESRWREFWGQHRILVVNMAYMATRIRYDSRLRPYSRLAPSIQCRVVTKYALVKIIFIQTVVNRGSSSHVCTEV